MLTAKVVYQVDGVEHERVFETPTVSSAFPCLPPPGDANAKQKQREPVTLGVYSVPDTGLVVIGNSAEGSESMAFAFGTVYIMNEHGRTVATYRLPNAPPWEDVVVRPTMKAA